MNLHRQFLDEIEAFIAHHEMRETAFGMGAIKDFSFVSRLRGGRMPNLRTVTRCREFMVAYEKKKARRRKPRPLERAAAA